MNRSTKRVWWLFILVISISVMVFALALTMRWKDIKSNHISELTNMVRLVQSSLESRFVQYDVLLDILGQQLSDTDVYSNKEKSRAIFAGIMSTDASIAGFGLADLQGNLVVAYPEIVDEALLPNLLEQEHTAQSFNNALKSSNIVIGRNYYNKVLDHWVVPFRKAIRNPQNEVVAVMTFGLYLSAFTNELSKQFKILIDRRVTLLREEDRFHQLLLSDDDSKIYHYSTPVPTELYERILTKIKTKYHTSINKIKEGNSAYIVNAIDEKGHNVIYSVVYDNKCNIWVIVDTHYSSIISNYFHSIYNVLALFTLGVIIVFYAFRLIAKKEEEKAMVRDYESQHDPLTGLYNRQYFNSFITSAVNTRNPFAILHISIDSFRKVNNVYGYSIGDKVLVEAANRLATRKSLFNNTIRYGGDVFLVIVNDLNCKRLFTLAKELRELMSTDYLVSGYKVSINCRVGIARYPIDSECEKELLRNVEVATEDAKLSNARVSFYQPNLYDSYHHHYRIESCLGLAIKNREITLAYQPQFNANGQLVGAESLARWNSHELGFVNPQEFIQVAEKSNLIFDLGNYLIDRAIGEFSNVDFASDAVTLSINVSVKQFMQNSFAEIVKETLIRHGFQPERLIIEVTESLFIDDLEVVYECLKELKGVGMSISLDDFGTGYSSLCLLKSLPIDEIKIDKSFVDDIVEDVRARKVLECIISISSEFGFNVVAEGVEDESQKRLLETLGTDIYQGYLFAKPMDFEQFRDFVSGQ